MTPDRELLRRYVHEASEEAFAEIVRRHVNLVYGTALRQLCGNPSLAQEVTQIVFTTLARKASGISPTTILPAWLHTTTRYTVSHTVRAERRRQEREQRAQTMHALLADEGASEPTPIPPQLLDEVLQKLPDDDRAAILLRFFGGQSFAAVGQAMDLSEDAARMRVSRALEKVREHFERNGITSTAAVVSATLSSQAIAAPAHLAATISTTALAATSGAKLGFFAFMSTTKFTSWITSAAAVGSLGLAGYYHHDATVRQSQVVAMADERDRLQAELKRRNEQISQLDGRIVQTEQSNAALRTRVNPPPTAQASVMSATKSLPPPANDARAQMTARLAKMKPLLESGMPIKGAVIVLVNGQAVPRPVEFVMGRETRISGTDDGTYIVTPTLNPDGSVKYALALQKDTPDGSTGNIQRLPNVTQTPWDSFTLSTGNGRVVAFDPDQD